MKVTAVAAKAAQNFSQVCLTHPPLSNAALSNTGAERLYRPGMVGLVGLCYKIFDFKPDNSVDKNIEAQSTTPHGITYDTGAQASKMRCLACDVQDLF